MSARFPRNERGATLFIALIMLVVLTMFAITAMNLSNVNLKIVGNMQSKKNVESVAQTTVEQIIGAYSNFGSPTAAVTIDGQSLTSGTATTMPSGSASAGMVITVSNRTCQYTTPATGYSAVQGISPEDDTWIFTVTVSDPLTSASTTVHQGARIRMLAGTCTGSNVEL